jgi:hypothetical protein
MTQNCFVYGELRVCETNLAKMDEPEELSMEIPSRPLPSIEF